MLRWNESVNWFQERSEQAEDVVAKELLEKSQTRAQAGRSASSVISCARWKYVADEVEEPLSQTASGNSCLARG